MADFKTAEIMMSFAEKSQAAASILQWVPKSPFAIYIL